MNRKQIVGMLTIMAVAFSLMVVVSIAFLLLGEDREAGASLTTYVSLMLLTIVVRELALQLPES